MAQFVNPFLPIYREDWGRRRTTTVGPGRHSGWSQNDANSILLLGNERVFGTLTLCLLLLLLSRASTNFSNPEHVGKMRSNFLAPGRSSTIPHSVLFGVVLPWITGME